MKNKGFTLIELLAVIVILAIIALIATPIILNIISDTKKESNKRGVELYASSVKNAIAAYQLREGKEVEVGTYSSADGKTLIKGTTTLNVEYDGNVQCNIVEIYEDGNIYLEDCIVNGTSTTKTYGIQQEILVKLNDICTPVTQTTASKDTEENLVGKIPTGNYELGDEYTCEVKEGTSYNFFVLSKEGNKVNLIMDSNIRTNGEAVKEANPTTEQKGLVAWLSKDDYKNNGGTNLDQFNDGGACQYGKSCSMNELGPITAVKYLKEATSSWNKVSSIVEIYNDEGSHFTDFKITGHARMPKKAEVEGSGCNLNSGSCPLWMTNYLDAETSSYPTRTIVNGVYGYWTLSANASDSFFAWYVNFSGYASTSFVQVSGYTVRPVISLEI